MKLKEMILYDIEIFKEECQEPDHSKFIFFRDFIIKGYKISQKEKLNMQLYIEKQMKSWLKKHDISLQKNPQMNGGQEEGL